MDLKTLARTLKQSLTNCSDLSQALQLFEMDDIQVVESKPLLVDRDLTVSILRSAKSHCLTSTQMDLDHCSVELCMLCADLFVPLCSAVLSS